MNVGDLIMAEKSAVTTGAGEDAVGELEHDTKERLLAKIEHLKAALAESRVGQTCRQYGAQIDEGVHQKPYHYIAGAAAVGVLVGLVFGVLIERRRD